MELRASTFGRCLRALVAEGLGYTPAPHTEATEQLFERGRDLEADAVTMLQEDGWWISPGQEEILLGEITGHLDGLCHRLDGVPDGRTRVLEIKSPKSWSHFQDAYKTDVWTDGLAVQYAWQTSIYQHATGLECVVATLDEGRVRTFVIEQPIHDLREIQARAGYIQNLVNNGEQGLAWAQCEPSANSFFCQMSTVTGCRDRTTTDDAELDALVRERAIVKVSLDLDKETYDSLTRQIEAALGDRTKVETDYATVTRYEQAGPARWDTDMMDRDGIDWNQYRRAGAPSSRLKITIRKGTDDADPTS